MKRKLIAFFIALFIIANVNAQEQYLGEIKICSFNFAPKGWAFCEGQLLLINQNSALFSLLGTTFGGNGTTNFALPDLRGRMVIGTGNSYPLGQTGGEAAHPNPQAKTPSLNHTHQIRRGRRPRRPENKTTPDMRYLNTSRKEYPPIFFIKTKKRHRRSSISDCRPKASS